MIRESNDSGRQADELPAEIEVTSEMTEAGLDVLAEQHVLDDWRYRLEAIYRAMHYAKRSASSTKPLK